MTDVYYHPPDSRTPGAYPPLTLPNLKNWSTAKGFLSYVPDTVAVATCRSSGTAVADSAIEFSYYDPSPNFGAVEAGMTMWIGNAAGTRNVGVYRVRKPPAAGVISIMQIGQADPGLGAIDLKSQYIEAGTQCTIFLVDLNLWAVAPRIDYESVTVFTFYKDYDRTWAGETAAPPVILNLGPHQAADLRGTGDTEHEFTIPVNLQSYPTTIGPMDIEWTLPAEATLTAGSLSSTVEPTTTAPVNVTYPDAAISFTLPAGFYRVKAVLTAKQNGVGTDYVGTDITTIAIRYFWVHDDDFPPIEPISIQTLNLSRQGVSIALQLAPSDLAKIRDLSFCMLWLDARWGGIAQDGVSTVFPGWASRVDTQLLPGTQLTNLTIQTPQQILSSLGGYSMKLSVPTDIAVGQDWWTTSSAYCGPEFLMYYLLRFHVANYLELFDLWLFASNTGQGFQAPVQKVGEGNVWNQLTQLAARIDAKVGCDSTGAMWIRMHPSNVVYPYRTDAITPTRCELDESWPVQVTNGEKKFTDIRKVNAAGFYIGADGAPVAVMSSMPGVSQGQGTSEEQLSDMFVIGQLDLDGRAGLHYAMLNNPFPEFQIELPGLFPIIEPSRYEFLTLSLDGSVTSNGVSISKRTIPNVVSYTGRGNGAFSTRITAEAETLGRSGTPVTLRRIDPPPPPPPPPPVIGGYAWTWTFDFITSNGGWFSASHNQAYYSAGVGWTTSGVGQLCELGARIYNHSLTTTSSIEYGEITYLVTTPVAPPSAFTNVLVLDGVSGLPLVVGALTTKPFTLSRTIGTSAFADIPALCCGYDSAGYAKIARIMLAGNGFKPTIS